MKKNILGIDYGTVRIGLAIANIEVNIATLLSTYQRQTPEVDARYFKKLAEEEEVLRFVVGLPVHLDGGESQKSIEAREFGKWLTELTGLPVDFFDERFTTKQANALLAVPGMTNKKKKARLDQLAAQIMLADYLESGGQSSDSLESIG